MLTARLLCLAVCLYTANAAARNDAATDLAGFLPGIQYVYTYSSTADMYQDVTLTSTAQVSNQNELLAHILKLKFQYVGQRSA